MTLSEHQLLREARRVLPKLLDGKKLLAHPSGSFLVVGKKPRRNAMRVDRAIVEAFLARGWICGSPAESFALSDAGLYWLKRAECADGDPFQTQHRFLVRRTIVDPDGIVREANINEMESPIAWLRHRGLIDAMQYEAGDRLRRDFTLAQLGPRFAADLEAPAVDDGGKSPGEFSDMVLAAKQRFLCAMKAVGPGLSDLLIDVCCHLVRLENIEQRLGWPKRSAKVVLQIALDRLGEHYGLCVKAPARARMRNWTAPSQAAVRA